MSPSGLHWHGQPISALLPGPDREKAEIGFAIFQLYSREIHKLKRFSPASRPRCWRSRSGGSAWRRLAGPRGKGRARRGRRRRRARTETSSSTKKEDLCFGVTSLLRYGERKSDEEGGSLKLPREEMKSIRDRTGMKLRPTCSFLQTRRQTFTDASLMRCFVGH